ncbi:hypothetical protein ACFLSZ_06610, partial [Candidatus Bipolaricaulota bacterium]
MKKLLVVVVPLILLSSSLAAAVQLESLSLGFHLIPSVERVGDERPLDLMLSFGATLRLDPE